MAGPGDRRRVLVAALLALAVAALIARSARRCASAGSRGHLELVTAVARFDVHEEGKLDIATTDGARALAAELHVLHDGDVLPLDLARLGPRLGGGLSGLVTVAGVDGKLVIRTRAPDVLELSIDAPGLGGSPAEARGEWVGTRLALVLPIDRRAVFVSGRGLLADLARESGPHVVLDDPAHPLGFEAAAGNVDVAIGPPRDDGGMRLSVAAPLTDGKATLRVVVGSSGAGVWRTLFELAGEHTARVAGSVTGVSGPAQVVGLGPDGAQRVRVATDAGGHFELFVPESVSRWYASENATRTSSPVTFKPGTPFPLDLDVSDGGEIHVRVQDADTHQPLTARLLVHGIDGTLDPDFGPDYRASGAGPIIDALRGEVTTPLPAGKYRVAATKGIEWSVDAQEITVEPGKSVDLSLAPRHVVPTPGEIGCDLHVHARPSFDSPVTVEDRVLSLVAAGVDFAVPTEHNIVGDYGPPLKLLGLSGEMATVTGVEVTTFSPRFGHFGVFPYPRSRPVPPFRHSTAAKVFAAAHAGDPNRVLQINHPRLPKGIGYFSVSGWDRRGPLPKHMRTDFDALEVYNGYDLPSPHRVDEVMADWFALLNMGHRYVATGSSDSHRIQYQWAGYPRTMVRYADADAPVDPLAVVAAIKKGHATVTSGPIIELQLGGGRPGDEVSAGGPTVSGHVVVRAAPWVDVTQLAVVANGRTVQTLSIESRPTELGPEAGTLEEAQARTIRLATDLHVDVAPGTTWVVVVARGERRLDDVLPFMPVQPLGFTNPVWVKR